MNSKPKTHETVLKAAYSKTIKCGKVEIKDDGDTPYSTTVSVDGKPLQEVYSLQSLVYKVNVKTGLSSLSIKYYQKSK